MTRLGRGGAELREVIRPHVVPGRASSDGSEAESAGGETAAPAVAEAAAGGREVADIYGTYLTKLLKAAR